MSYGSSLDRYITKCFTHGYAITASELMLGFDKEKLKGHNITRYDKSKHYERILPRIFVKLYFLVINDIIDNNITYHVYSGSTTSVTIKMKVYRDLELVRFLRDKLILKDNIDFIKTGRKLAMISFFIKPLRKPEYERRAYMSLDFTKRITQNMYKGVAYGDSINDKKIDDYKVLMLKEYPDADWSLLKKIIFHGWMHFVLCLTTYTDMYIKSKEGFMYFGKIYLETKVDREKFLGRYYIERLTKKIMRIRKFMKLGHDLYCYFVVTNKRLRLIEEQLKTTNMINYGFVKLYRVKDLCLLRLRWSNLYKVDTTEFESIIAREGFYFNNFTTDKARYIGYRKTRKLEDVLFCKNRYDFTSTNSSRKDCVTYFNEDDK